MGRACEKFCADKGPTDATLIEVRRSRSITEGDTTGQGVYPFLLRRDSWPAILDLEGSHACSDLSL